ncbi:post-GPI attachment to proteins factor 2-like [Mya arenaria]|uniref:post-GPI attachment to proteins factor 2-like n=1 Tax=Mya arenaria TaxID=6604 RepID=UPI0022DF42A7|nr:post-GPI attachment to proteins factor 2-like [Mya arenaria]
MGNRYLNVSDNLLCIPFLRYAVITVSLPALSLTYCFLSAYLFRGDEINQTDCNVTNTIPSVSAVTGIKPQTYVWRICIGIHTTPRFFVGIMYYNYYRNSVPYIHQGRALYKFLIKLCFFLYTLECFCLHAVSCISNKENYPIHEKIFVVFMICSVANELFGTLLYRWSKYRPMTKLEERSYFWKRVNLFVTSVSTVGLLYFFVQHRFYCIPGAFSYFSVFEYLIAYSNMGYHITGYLDFHGQSLLAGHIEEPVSNGLTPFEESQNGHLSSQSNSNGVSHQKTNIPVRNRKFNG